MQLYPMPGRRKHTPCMQLHDIDLRWPDSQESKGRINLRTSPGHRVSQGHPAGQTGVYRLVSQGLPVVYYRKTDRKGHFCRDTGWVSQRHLAVQGVFRDFM